MSDVSLIPVVDAGALAAVEASVLMTVAWSICGLLSPRSRWSRGVEDLRELTGHLIAIGELHLNVLSGEHPHKVGIGHGLLHGLDENATFGLRNSLRSIDHVVAGGDDVVAQFL